MKPFIHGLIAVSCGLLSGSRLFASTLYGPDTRLIAQVQGVSVGQPAAVSLRLRRNSDSVEILVQGTGASPILQQTRAGDGWRGDLRLSVLGVLAPGPQRFALPEAGIKSASLVGNGSQFQIAVDPMPGVKLSRPVLTADGRNLLIVFEAPPQTESATNSLNLNAPGAIPQANYAPPLQPRAVAPPLGDMAVGSMVLRNQSYVNLTGPNVTLSLRNAPAKDALMSLAQLGGYGFVYVDDPQKESSGAKQDLVSSRPVSISFRNESFAKSFNSVLLAAGLQGKKEGNTIFAGPNVLSKTFGPQLSKVFRLNQASAMSAADYLASLGAQITKVNVITNTVTQGTSQANEIAGGQASQQTQTQNVTTTETYGSSTGPLRGLSGTTDSRLQTITLIGESGLIAVAENYLRQLDLRQRQVALSVKILDVNLDNDSEIANSFAFRSGTNFIVNDDGRLAGVFGGFVPPTSDDIAKKEIPNDGVSATADENGITYTGPTGVQAMGQASPVSNDGSIANGLKVGGMNTGVRPNPGLQYPANQFYDLVRASITSSNTKVLASPTLIISENPEAINGGQEVSVGAGSALTNASIGRPFANESYVTVGTQVITDYTVQAGQNGAPNSCQPEFGTSGLTFGARVSKIDDNGFITFSLSPSVSATTATQRVEGCGNIEILSVRRLDTGTVRVRDGQTLILTGVIQESDAQVVTKWPVLGDIPFIGQFFRASGGKRKKSELVIMVTPRIIDDTQGGSYGYGFNPSTSAVQRMMSGSF